MPGGPQISIFVVKGLQGCSGYGACCDWPVAGQIAVTLSQPQQPPPPQCAASVADLWRGIKGSDSKRHVAACICYLFLLQFGTVHPAARGVQQKQSGKKVMKK